MASLRHADSFRRTAQVCPANRPNEERHIARAEPSAHGRQTQGQPAPVKAVSRRSRARKARALTGVGWSGNSLPSDHGLAKFSIACSTHEVSRRAPLAIEPITPAPCERHRSDHLNHLERTKGGHPAHLAGYRAPAAAPCAKPMCRQRFLDRSRAASSRTPVRFILLTTGRWSPPRRSCAILRQVAIRQKPGEAPRQQTSCRLIAVVMPTNGSVARASCSPNRPRQGWRSRGRRTGCSQIRRGTDLRMSGIVESGRESGHGDIDPNDPHETSGRICHDHNAIDLN